MTVEITEPHTNLSGDGSRAELRVYEDEHFNVRLEIACVAGCAARLEQRLDGVSFKGALLLGVHPASGEVDIATIWEAGTGLGVYVYNISAKRIRQVLDEHTNVTPEFNINYIGHDGLVIPDDMDASSGRYGGATVYSWNGVKFDGRRVKRYHPRNWWRDGGP